jgi:hypothetical protein
MFHVPTSAFHRSGSGLRSPDSVARFRRVPVPSFHPTTSITSTSPYSYSLLSIELELELIQTQMAQKPMLRAEVGMRVRCANKASAE